MKRYYFAGKFNLVIASIFIMLLANCAKEDDKPELDYSKVYLVKNKIVNGDFSDVVYHYEYDTNGKLSYYTITPPSDYSLIVEHHNYQYVSSSLIYEIHSNEYSIPDTTILELNEMGLVVTEHKPKIKFIRRIKYNDEGYRIYDKYGRYVTDTSDITWTSENRYRVIDGNYDQPHYDDKINTLGYVNFGMPYYGKSSKNLEKKINSTDTFDSLQRLSSRRNNDFSEEYSYY